MTENSCLESVLSLIDSVNQNVVGQEHLTQSLVIALLTGGHVLLEGLPGTAKTRSVKSLATALNIDFKRVQFTPDLLPSDVTGSNVYDKDSGTLKFQAGPIFSSILLADEVNRAPAKVQAALLEAMAEGTVTTNGKTLALPEPFMVLATQNPIEQEGTYPLPEAQMDRFIMKVDVSYPSLEAEMDIIRLVRQEALISTTSNDQEPSSTLSIDRIREAKEKVKRIYSSESIDTYIATLVAATRQPEHYPYSQLHSWLAVGVSPRASIALDSCSRAHAWLGGRDYVTPDDVRSVAHSVLGHRISLSFEALSMGVSKTEVVDELLKVVPLT
ncbi:AAA family ATPase [Vibrio agarivorans]|uniref:MoxR family ATPase n=1 Tax=Vibrio agarivorans TaxID=153622 RepID=A0ABT7XZI3_9VIBR|nr:MoxR family ATPase [Vibrio agarivorans]MDN2481184.1 MoxR family ATPase [Vibrio agarivorans]